MGIVGFLSDRLDSPGAACPFDYPVDVPRGTVVSFPLMMIVELCEEPTVWRGRSRHDFRFLMGYPIRSIHHDSIAITVHSQVPVCSHSDRQSILTPDMQLNQM